MNKVTTINLNGKSYQMEETGFESLKNYLDKARNDLKENPDKDEILADLEQAIADKCSTYLNQNKNVVLSTEIQKIIEEMGPVASGTENSEHTSEHANTETKNNPKRLYQIKEGAMISGVCNGIAAYFDVDVTLVRALFIILTFITGGGFILAYIIMAFIIPRANTPEEKASALDLPKTAQELVSRAKENYKHFTDTHSKQEWRQKKQEMKRLIRENSRRWKHEYHHGYQGGGAWAYTLRPLVDTVVALIWLSVVILFVWFARNHTGELHSAVDQIHTAIQRFIDWIAHAF